MTSIDKYQGEIDFNNANWERDNFFEGGSQDFDSRPNPESDDYWSDNYAKEKTYADKATFLCNSKSNKRAPTFCSKKDRMESSGRRVSETKQEQ